MVDKDKRPFGKKPFIKFLINVLLPPLGALSSLHDYAEDDPNGEHEKYRDRYAALMFYLLGTTLLTAIGMYMWNEYSFQLGTQSITEALGLPIWDIGMSFVYAMAACTVVRLIAGIHYYAIDNSTLKGIAKGVGRGVLFGLIGSSDSDVYDLFLKKDGTPVNNTNRQVKVRNPKQHRNDVLEAMGVPVAASVEERPVNSIYSWLDRLRSPHQQQPRYLPLNQSTEENITTVEQNSISISSQGTSQIEEDMPSLSRSFVTTASKFDSPIYSSNNPDVTIDIESTKNYLNNDPEVDPDPDPEDNSKHPLVDMPYQS